MFASQHGLFSDDGDSSTQGAAISPEDDNADKPQVVIIDEKFAQRFWPDRRSHWKTLVVRSQEADDDRGCGGRSQAVRPGDGTARSRPISRNSSGPILECFWRWRTSSERQDCLSGRKPNPCGRSGRGGLRNPDDAGAVA